MKTTEQEGTTNFTNQRSRVLAVIVRRAAYGPRGRDKHAPTTRDQTDNRIPNTWIIILIILISFRKNELFKHLISFFLRISAVSARHYLWGGHGRSAPTKMKSVPLFLCLNIFVLLFLISEPQVIVFGERESKYSNKFGISLALHYLFITQAAALKNSNKFGISLALH